MVDFSRIRFGRRQHDPQRLAAVRPHVMAAAAPAPATLPRTDLAWIPSLVRNTTLPTCTIAGLLNASRVWSLLPPRGFDLVSDDPALLAFYAGLAGCAPTDAAIGATDGLVMLDVLEHASAYGFPTGGQQPLAPGFTAVAHSGEAIRDAIFAKGSVYVGVTLYEADVQPGLTVWAGGTSGAGAAVGAHCICGWAYGPGTISFATWGETMVATEEWLLARLDEAYAVEPTLEVAE